MYLAAEMFGGLSSSQQKSHSRTVAMRLGTKGIHPLIPAGKSNFG